MSDGVQISVRSALSQVIDELASIRDAATETQEEFKKAGEGVADGLQKNVKNTEVFFGNLRGLSRRVADQLRGDFKSLLSINALKDAAGISNIFRKNVAETFELSNAIRKLGSVFGIAGDDFAAFQTKITQGLGEVGLSSEVATRALGGLSQTQVRGQDNLVQYAAQSGMLSSITREEGKEGDIAGGMARVIQARGGNENDQGQMKQLAEDLRRVFVQTGVGPTQILRNMEQIFATMPQDLRKAITTSALSSLSVASAVGGPNSTKFLEEYLGKSPIARLAFQGQGGGKVMGKNGLDTAEFKKFFKQITGRIGFDPRAAATTLGLSEEAAEGFIRLGENLDKVAAAQARVSKTAGDLATQYRASMHTDKQ